MARWEQGRSRLSGTSEAVLQVMIYAILGGASGLGLVARCRPGYAIFKFLSRVFQEVGMASVLAGVSPSRGSTPQRQ